MSAMTTFLHYTHVTWRNYNSKQLNRLYIHNVIAKWKYDHFDIDKRWMSHWEDPPHINMSHIMRKTALCHMWTTKAQISLRIHADWSAPLLFAASIDSILLILAKAKLSRPQVASVTEQAGLICTSLHTLEDRFPHDVAYMCTYHSW